MLCFSFPLLTKHVTCTTLPQLLVHVASPVPSCVYADTESFWKTLNEIKISNDTRLVRYTYTKNIKIGQYNEETMQTWQNVTSKPNSILPRHT